MTQRGGESTKVLLDGQKIPAPPTGGLHNPSETILDLIPSGRGNLSPGGLNQVVGGGGGGNSDTSSGPPGQGQLLRVQVLFDAG